MLRRVRFASRRRLCHNRRIPSPGIRTRDAPSARVPRARRRARGGLRAHLEHRVAARHRRSAAQRRGARRPHDEHAEKHARPLRISAVSAVAPSVRAGCPDRPDAAQCRTREPLSRRPEPPRPRDRHLHHPGRTACASPRATGASRTASSASEYSVSAVFHRCRARRHRPFLRARHGVARAGVLHLAAGFSRRHARDRSAWRW